MARLTNLQLEVLATSIVDMLEENFKEKMKNYKESEEYKARQEELLKTKDYQEMKNLLEKYKEAELVYESISDNIKNMYRRLFSTNYAPHPTKENYLDRLERKLIGDESRFDRDKMMTKIQAAILLGDSTDAKEIFEKLTKEYGADANKQLFSE